MASKTLISGIGLVALGAVSAVAVTHLRIGWQRSDAAPNPPVAAEAQAALPPPSSSQVSEARSLGRTFAQVASQLSPSVVRISVAKTVKQHNPFSNTPFGQFFGDEDNNSEGGARGQKQRGMGSGVVFDDKGYILTNNHVVEGADEVKVSFIDGKTVPGKVVGTDPKSDLAVVKVDGVAVKAAKFGDSDKMQVGEWTIAIGNPFGLDHTVTVGVLSAKGRTGFTRDHYEDFLQTDASINPGNSGGPLVNLDGQIIGINTMIAGMGTGIGFAVPSAMAKPVAEQLMKGGKVRRPYIGIQMEDLRPEVAKAFGDKAPEKGAVVDKLVAGAPAEKAGVKVGDVIVKVDGQEMDGSSNVQHTILGKQIGQRVELVIWRDGKEQKLATTTGELPGDPEQASRAVASNDSHATLGVLGLANLTNLTPQIAQELELPPGTHGAVIERVRSGSPAEEAGVQRGDVITEIDRHPVANADDAARLLGQTRASGHLVRIVNKEASRYIALSQ
jgi:serine protease Do